MGKSVFLIYNLGSSFDMSPPDYFQGAPIFLSDLHYTDISRDGKEVTLHLLSSRSIPMGTELKTIGAVQSFVGQPDGSPARNWREPDSRNRWTRSDW